MPFPVNGICYPTVADAHKAFKQLYPIIQPGSIAQLNSSIAVTSGVGTMVIQTDITTYDQLLDTSTDTGAYIVFKECDMSFGVDGSAGSAMLIGFIIICFALGFQAGYKRAFI